MDKYSIKFAHSAVKELEALPSKVLNRVFPKIELLAEEPRPYGTRKLTGESHTWRIRVGDYRVVYTVDDAARAVDIVAVRHRRDAYR
jgi:mRNA interferase RelE/StbE